MNFKLCTKAIIHFLAIFKPMFKNNCGNYYYFYFLLFTCGWVITIIYYYEYY